MGEEGPQVGMPCSWLLGSQGLSGGRGTFLGGERGGGSSLWLGRVASLVSGSKPSYLLSGPQVEFLMVSRLP